MTKKGQEKQHYKYEEMKGVCLVTWTRNWLPISKQNIKTELVKRRSKFSSHSLEVTVENMWPSVGEQNTPQMTRILSTKHFAKNVSSLLTIKSRAGGNEWFSSNRRLSYAHRIMGSPGGKHCKSLQRRSGLGREILLDRPGFCRKGGYVPKVVKKIIQVNLKLYLDWDDD